MPLDLTSASLKVSRDSMDQVFRPRPNTERADTRPSDSRRDDHDRNQPRRSEQRDDRRSDRADQRRDDGDKRSDSAQSSEQSDAPTFDQALQQGAVPENALLTAGQTDGDEGQVPVLLQAEAQVGEEVELTVVLPGQQMTGEGEQSEQPLISLEMSEPDPESPLGQILAGIEKAAAEDGPNRPVNTLTGMTTQTDGSQGPNLLNPEATVTTEQTATVEVVVAGEHREVKLQVVAPQVQQAQVEQSQETNENGLLATQVVQTTEGEVDSLASGQGATLVQTGKSTGIDNGPQIQAGPSTTDMAVAESEAEAEAEALQQGSLLAPVGGNSSLGNAFQQAADKAQFAIDPSAITSSSASDDLPAAAPQSNPVTPPRGPEAAAPVAAPAVPANSETEEKVSHQVKRAVVQQLANGDRSLTLRLTPPSLGTVRIELIEHRGVISVRFAAEDDGVRQAIERQLPQIRQDLRAADAPIAQVQLDEQAGAFHQDRSDDQPGQQAQNEQRQSARDGQPTFDLDGGFADEPEDEALVSTPSLGGTVNDDAVDARA